MSLPKNATRHAMLFGGCVVLGLLFLANFRDPPAPEPEPSLAASAVSANPAESTSTIEGFAKRVQDLMGSELRDDVAQKVVRGWIDEEWPRGAGDASAILGALDSPDDDVRWVALLGVDRYGVADDALFKSVMRLTGDGPAYVRRAAFGSFARFASVDRDVAVKMRAACRSADPEVLITFLRSLSALAPDGETQALLLAHLTHDEKLVRRAAAYGIAALDLGESKLATSDALIQALVAGLGDADPYVRACSARAVERVGRPAAEAAAPTLVALLDDDRAVVRWATMALVACGERAIDPIAEALRDGRATPSALVRLLRRIDGPGVMPVLRNGLAHADPVVRAECAIALHLLKDEETDAPAALAALLDSQDVDVLVLALEGLTMMADAAGDHRAAIAPLGQHDDERVRQVVTQLLRRIGT